MSKPTQFRLWLAALVVSVLVLGWLVGNADAARCKEQRGDPNVCVQAPGLDEVLRWYRLGPRAVAQ